MNIIKIKDRFAEMLRTVYKEPARTSLSKRHTTVVGETHIIGAADVDVTVTNIKLLCVNSVSHEGTAKVKYLDYDIDLRSNKIVYKTAPGAGTTTIGYDYNSSGYSWIHPANPERDQTSSLTRIDYPRVTIQEIDSRSSFIGFNSDKQDNTVILQIDIATKDGLKASNYVRVKTDGTTETITVNTMNTDLIDVLALGIKNAIKRNWRDYKNAFYLGANAFRGETSVLVDNDISLFRRAIDVEIKGFDLGESS